MRIAVLAQNARALAPIRDVLAAQGIEVTDFSTIERLAAGLEAQAFAAVLLEGRADHLEQGLGMLQQRAEAGTAIVIVGKGGAASISHALMHGADDYVFSNGDVEYAMQRIIARIGVKVQRHRRGSLRIGSLGLDVAARAIASSGTLVRLTARETLLARLLFESVGRIVPIERLCVELCGASGAAAVRSVNQHVYQLRRKLERLSADDDRLRIEALYGTGYRLVR
jgi:DNA-binding response OmpR family regulator